MIKFILACTLVGETLPLLFLTAYRYIGATLGMTIFDRVKLVLWPFSIMLLMTGGSDQAADDQTRAIAILLNGIMYSAIGLIELLRKRVRPRLSFADLSR
jgi:hypothetical protein